MVAMCLQDQLNSLTKDFTSTAASAQRTLRGLFGGSGGKPKEPPGPVPDLDAVPTGKLRPGYGSQARGGIGTGEKTQQQQQPSGTGGWGFRLPGTGSRGVKRVSSSSSSRGSGSVKAGPTPKASAGAPLLLGCCHELPPSMGAPIEGEHGLEEGMGPV
jgi:hypothetical protein